MLHMPNPILMVGGATPQPTGQVLFEASGTFVVPEGCVSICVVAIGRGEGGYRYGAGWGGPLVYTNNITTKPGEALTVTVSGYAELARGGAAILRAAAGPDGPSQSDKSIGAVFHSGGPPSVGGEAGLSGGGAGGYTGAGGAGSNGEGWGQAGFGTSLMGGGAGAQGGNGSNGAADGGTYGGGGAYKYNDILGAGGRAGLRIIYGVGRAFPYTLTGDL